MKTPVKTKELSAEQLKSRKRRVSFLTLMIISGFCAVLTLHLATPGVPLFIPWVCLCGINILTFFISGYRLFANLLQWMMQEP